MIHWNVWELLTIAFLFPIFWGWGKHWFKLSEIVAVFVGLGFLTGQKKKEEKKEINPNKDQEVGHFWFYVLIVCVFGLIIWGFVSQIK